MINAIYNELIINLIFTYISAMVLVTGATGFVGAHLLYELIAQGENVRALYRTKTRKSAVKALFRHRAARDASVEADNLFLKINWYQADITDLPSISKAFDSVEYVYHCAAMLSFNPTDFKKMHKINVEGTANMVNLSIDAGIKKFCHVSSIAALGKTENQIPITEDTHWTPARDNSGYSITKFASEMEVWRSTQEGLKAIVVNPAIIIGAGFYDRGSGTFFKLIDHGMHYTTAGASAFVDVRDVVRAMTLLMKSDTINQRFILAGQNMTFDDFYRVIARALNTKAPAPMVRVWQINLAWQMDYVANLLFGKKRKLFRTTANAAMNSYTYDNSKFMESFDFKFTALEDTITWAAQHYKDPNNRY